MLYLSDFNSFPIALGLRMYQSMAGTWANQLMAVSLMALVPVVLVFVVCERVLMRGVSRAGSMRAG